jgi:hypothetical protein
LIAGFSHFDYIGKTEIVINYHNFLRACHAR